MRAALKMDVHTDPRGFRIPFGIPAAANDVLDFFQEDDGGVEIDTARVRVAGTVAMATGAIGLILFGNGREGLDIPANDQSLSGLGDEKLDTPLPRHNYTKMEPLNVLPIDRLQAAIVHREHWKNAAMEALKRFEGADPKVAEIMKLIDERAYYGIPAGPGTTVMLRSDPPRPENGFQIVFLPEEIASQIGYPLLTRNYGRTMMVSDFHTVEEWFGMHIAHELMHVYAGIIRKDDFYDEKLALAGEVEAHLLEMKMLRHWSPETYERLITEGGELYEAGKHEEFRQLAARLYPLSVDVLSEYESMHAMSTILTAVAFELAMRDGVDQEGLMEVYKDLTTKGY
jgi:hypothetical protein